MSIRLPSSFLMQTIKQQNFSLFKEINKKPIGLQLKYIHDFTNNREHFKPSRELECSEFHTLISAEVSWHESHRKIVRLDKFETLPSSSKKSFTSEINSVTPM